MLSDEDEFVIYKGEEYTLEWYFDGRGKSRALDYFNSMPIDQQRKTLYLFITMGNMGKIMNKTKFRSEEDGIYAFKPKPDRFLCFFFRGKKIVVTNAFKKRQDKLPKEEKRRALKYKKDYEMRVKRGKYYDC